MPTSLKLTLWSRALLLSTLVPLVASAVGNEQARSFSASPSGETFVLSISSSRGGPSTQSLAFSEKDAERFTTTMIHYGNVPPENVVELHNPGVSELKEQLAELNTRLAKSSARHRSLYVYYSGHANARGLALGQEVFAKEELHRQTSASPAETKVVVLDSCFSGSLARKGKAQERERPQPPRLHIDRPQGLVFFTSSAEHELSYESRELEGGLFTHHLISGLRGQADLDGDGLVVLDEVYRYVFGKTTMDLTLLPNGKEQFPELLTQLKGKGSLVLTYPGESETNLTLDAALNGHVRIAAASGTQVWQISKQKGQLEKIRLPQGLYEMRLRSEEDAEWSQATLDLRDGATLVVRARDLSPLPRTQVASLSKKSRSTAAVAQQATEWEWQTSMGAHTGLLYKDNWGMSWNTALSQNWGGRFVRSFGQVQLLGLHGENSSRKYKRSDLLGAAVGLGVHPAAGLLSPFRASLSLGAFRAQQSPSSEAAFLPLVAPSLTYSWKASNKVTMIVSLSEIWAVQLPDASKESALWGSATSLAMGVRL